MSFWYHKKEKDGRRNLVAIDIPFELIGLIIGLFFVLIGSRFWGTPSQIIADAFHLITAGFLLLLISKVSLFIKGIWISWGYSHIAKIFKLFYILGYILIGIGMLVIFVSYKAGLA